MVFRNKDAVRARQAPGQASHTRPLPDLACAASPVTHLVHLLQGSPEAAVADVGITQRSPPQLALLAEHASAEAAACGARMDLLLRLVRHALDQGRPPATELLAEAARHVRRLAHDQRRWRQLADNAAYYCAHPELASRLREVLNRG